MTRAIGVLLLTVVWWCVAPRAFAADTKISALTAQTDVAPVSDVLAIVDTSAASTKKITVADLVLPGRGHVLCWDDFFGAGGLINNAVHGGSCSILLNATGSGAGIAGGTAGELSHPGISHCDTGTTTTGRCTFQSDEAIRFSGGTWVYETIVRLPALSDGTDTYEVYFGFGDAASSEPADGAYFKYTHSVFSGNWACVTANNATRTSTDSATAVAAATWYRLRIEVNAAGTSVAFYVNGSSVCTNTTNIPTSAGRETGLLPLNIRKSAGTTERGVDIDYYKYIGTLDTLR